MTLDFELQRELAQYYSGRMATGENLFSHHDGRNLLRYAGMRPGYDVLQLDCAQLRLRNTSDFLNFPEHGFSMRDCIPHGGHQMSLNIAAGLA